LYTLKDKIKKNKLRKILFKKVFFDTNLFILWYNENKRLEYDL